MNLSLGFSPCPNDTFIFDGLVNKRINTAGIQFNLVLEDVQTLNEWAIEGKLDVTKISYAVLPLILKNYVVLNAGSALGRGVGPLLVARSEIRNLSNEIRHLSVAIPGKDTTANLLFSLAFPDAGEKKFMIFSSIEEAVLKNEVDCGVIIHENRFTYQQKGLMKLVDLGEFWEKETGFPIPLGGIVIRKGYNYDLKKKVNELIRQSIELSFANYPFISDFVKTHSQEMQEDIMRKHIELYVNDYSLNLGEAGIHAIQQLLKLHQNTTASEQLDYSNIFL